MVDYLLERFQEGVGEALDFFSRMCRRRGGEGSLQTAADDHGVDLQRVRAGRGRRVPGGRGFLREGEKIRG